MTYLGLVFNSKKMSVTLTSEKKEKIIESCKSLFKKDSFTIRELSILIRTLTSTFPGNKFGPLYYRELDKSKTLGLKKAKGSFDTLIKLTKEAILDLQWWIKNLYTVSKKLQYPGITKVIYTDAAMDGWGAYCEGISTGGSWINTENNWHINALELKSKGIVIWLGMDTLP